MNNIEIIASTGRLLSKIDKCVCDFLTLNENSYSCKFLILKGLKYDLIIGADFLNKHGVVIDYDSREIRLDKNCVKFENVIKRIENEGCQELIINGLYKGMNNSIWDKEIFDVGDEFNENGDCNENIRLERNVMNVVDYEEDNMKRNIAPDIFQHKLVECG
ncbi:hypothetical protein QE152_g33425 [Popillia japonica]|uniref:Uncharacterized protein n=1 Tax=Popillia japonica TaxID=7064 RepID=A0AAW1IX62_POPJA